MGVSYIYHIYGICIYIQYHPWLPLEECPILRYDEIERVFNVKVEKSEEYDDYEKHEEEKLRTCLVAAVVHTWIKYTIWLTMLEWQQR